MGKVSRRIRSISLEKGDSTRDKWTLAVLATIVVSGAALRLAGIDFGLPYVVGDDEGFEVHRALRLGAGEFDFSRITKGGIFYILFVEYAFYYVWLWITGAVSSPSEFAMTFVLDPEPFWLMGRLTNALLSVAIIIWTYIIGQRIYGSVPALLAAGFVAMSALDVVQAHFISVDVLMTLAVLITLDLAARWSDPSRRAHVVLLGVAFGFAMSAKAPAVMAGFSILIANWLRYRGEHWSKRILGGEMIAAYVVAFATLAATNPGLMLRILRIKIDGVSAASATIVSAWGAGENLWIFYLDAAAQSYGALVVALIVAGAAIAVLRFRGSEILLLSFAIPYFVTICVFDTKHLYYSRYLLPLVPCAGLLLCRVVVELSALVRPPAARIAVVSLFIAVAILPTSVRSIDHASRYLGDDTRRIALNWVEANVPAGTSIFVVGNPLRRESLSVPLDDSVENQMRIAADLRASGSPLKAQVVEMAARGGRSPKYKLYTVMHTDPNLTLDEYSALGVVYFVLSGYYFDPEHLADDTRRARQTLDSRSALRRDLEARGELLFKIDPREGRHTGPAIKVYRVVSRKGQ